MKTRSPVRAARRQGGTRDAAARQGSAIRGRPRLEPGPARSDRRTTFLDRDWISNSRWSRRCPGRSAPRCRSHDKRLLRRRRNAHECGAVSDRGARRRLRAPTGGRSGAQGGSPNRQRAGRSRPTGHTNAPPGRPSPIEPRKPCPFFAAESWRGCCDRPYPASPSSRGLGRGPFKAKTWVRIPLGTPLDSQTPFRRCVGFGVAAAIDLFRHQRRADAALTVPNRKDPHFVLTWNVVDVMSRRSQ